MLAYLDALLDALAIRDRAEVDRLLSHPLARVLPEAARDEARRIGQGTADPLAAPLRVMQLRHLTAELLHESSAVPIVADRPAAGDVRAATPRGAVPATAEPRRRATVPGPRAARPAQMELPLSA